MPGEFEFDDKDDYEDETGYTENKHKDSVDDMQGDNSSMHQASARYVRDEKTEKALATIEASRRAAATMDDSDSDFDTRRQVSEDEDDDELISSKVRWKGSTVRVTVARSDKLGVLFENFSKKVGIRMDRLAFRLNGQELNPWDTVSDNVTIITFIDAFELEDQDVKGTKILLGI